MKSHVKMALVGAMALCIAAFAFQSDMTPAQVEEEIATRISNGESVEVIARASLEAGIDPSVLVSGLISRGVSIGDVMAGCLAAGVPAQTVIAASLASGVAATDVVAAANNNNVPPETTTNALIVAGLDPTTFVEPTAAGPGQVNKGNRGDPIIPAGPFVGSSPPPTTGGGGGGGASPS